MILAEAGKPIRTFPLALEADMKDALFALVAAAVFVVAMTWFYSFAFTPAGVSFFGPDADPGNVSLPVWRLALSAFLMVAGILFGTIYNALKDENEDVDITTELARTFRRAAFWRALLVAPIVFIGVYLAARSQPDVTVASLLAFQNGFFCHELMKKRREGMDDKPPPVGDAGDARRDPPPGAPAVTK